MRDDAKAAHQLYLDLAKYTSTVGAYSFADGQENAHLKLGERTSEIARVFKEAPDSPKPEEERGHLLFHVPSPWHAVIHLLANNRGWLSGENSLGRQMALIYRGQRDSTWSLLPSIYRENVDFDIESKTIYVFVDLVERFFRSQLQTLTDIVSPSLMLLSDRFAPPTPKVVHVGTAQHFGIKTHLLDFSFDPAVAVWFACQGTRGEVSELASVFALPTRIGMVAGAATLFPHPYIRRLYRQRGLFVQPVNSIHLRQLCVEVRFPPDPSFEVLRDDYKRPELLPSDEWWEMLVRIARRIVEKGLSENLMSLDDQGKWEFFSFLLDECDLTSEEENNLLDPKFLYMEAKREQLIESAEELLQMLLCLTTALYDNITPRISNTAIRYCVANSGTTLSAMLPILQRLVESMPSKLALRQASEPMLQELKKELENQNYPTLGEGWYPH